MPRRVALLAVSIVVGLAACSGEPPAPEPESTVVPRELAIATRRPPARPAGDAAGTPMAQRVATIGLLNKRNNLTRDLTMKPGSAQRVGNVVVRVEACERTPPWESPPETGAFVQVLVEERQRADQPLRWNRVFSGWLFKNSPSLNVVEHPVYDVWVKDCAMKFPGEDAAPAATASSAADDSEA